MNVKIAAGSTPATKPTAHDAHAATPSKLKGATYNCEIGRKPAEVAKFVSQTAHREKLDFIQLQEISTYRDALKGIKGYHLIVFPGSKDHGETGVLVRDGIKATRSWSAQSSTGWTNVHGGKAQPRAATTVLLGGWLRVVSVHAPPGIDWKNGHAVGPEQRIKAYGSVSERLLRLAKRQEKQHPDHALLIGGDWNEGATSGGKWSPSWLAAQAGMKKHATGHIDWEMSRGCKVTDTKVGASGGSDHRMVTFTVARPAHHPKAKPAAKANAQTDSFQGA